MRPSTIFFAAAGLGTRLRPLTDELPKALVPVGNQPQLVRLCRRYEDLRRVANSHHHAELIAACVANERLDLHLSRELDVLGTAGGLGAARTHFGPGPVIVHNADIEVPHEVVRAMVDGARGEALATLLVGADQPAGRSPVGLDAARRVVRLRDVTRPGAVEASSCEYLGVALASPEMLERLPARGCLVGEVWIPALLGGALLEVAPATLASRAEAAFFDLGTPRRYLDANLAWLDEQGLSVRAEAGSELAAPASQALVGRGARVLAAIERVVVWPGATVREPLCDAVVTPRRVVRVDHSGR